MSNHQLKKTDGEKAYVRIINKRFNDKCKHISLEIFSDDYKTIEKKANNWESLPTKREQMGINIFFRALKVDRKTVSERGAYKKIR
ncbi:MAG: hypothetical protein ACI8Q1_000458 [Parvicella sp.]|jgi:hypothetical protein